MRRYRCPDQEALTESFRDLVPIGAATVSHSFHRASSHFLLPEIRILFLGQSRRQRHQARRVTKHNQIWQSASAFARDDVAWLDAE